jgi:hypothetical protein
MALELVFLAQLDIATYQISSQYFKGRKKSPDNLKFEQKIQVQGP